MRGRPIYDEAGVMRFIEGLAIDVTALKHAEGEKLAFERNLSKRKNSKASVCWRAASPMISTIYSPPSSATLRSCDMPGSKPIPSQEQS